MQFCRAVKESFSPLQSNYFNDVAGSVLQFTQNEDKRLELLGTAGTTLVYADPYDTLLGIGLGMRSPDVCKQNKWQGQNLLGNVLTDIRDEFLSNLQVCNPL